MSLEQKIDVLTAAVTALTAEMQSRHSMIAQLQSSNVAAPVPVAPTPAPVVQAAPVPMHVVIPTTDVPAPVAVAMPAPPVFVAPVAAPAPIGAPFTDGKGLIDYVMSAYKALGPQKGAQIQNVLTGMGYQNINDVKPEHYGQLFAGVEALK
jgi:hypothetical protein